MLVSLLVALGALALLTLLPGPDVAVVTRVALSDGRRAATTAAAGVVSGLLVWGVLTVAGLAALLAASTTAYTVVKLTGAAYLLLLGVVTIGRSRARGASTSLRAASSGRGHPYRSGLLTNLLNPKIAVFYTSLLPQLVPAGAPEAVTLAGLVLAHALIAIAWLTCYAALLTRASTALRHPRVRRLLDRVTGTVLIGFGLRVAVAGRA